MEDTWECGSGFKFISRCPNKLPLPRQCKLTDIQIFSHLQQNIGQCLKNGLQTSSAALIPHVCTCNAGNSWSPELWHHSHKMCVRKGMETGEISYSHRCLHLLLLEVRELIMGCCRHENGPNHWFYTLSGLCLPVQSAAGAVWIYEPCLRINPFSSSKRGVQGAINVEGGRLWLVFSKITPIMMLKK